jgi:hypothetical protein
MKIVLLGSDYYIPGDNGYTRITKAEAMDFYEKGEVSHEEVLSYEHD